MGVDGIDKSMKKAVSLILVIFDDIGKWFSRKP
jgi:hypothetical protein